MSVPSDLETAVVVAVDLPALATIYEDSYPALAKLSILSS